MQLIPDRISSNIILISTRHLQPIFFDDYPPFLPIESFQRGFIIRELDPRLYHGLTSLLVRRSESMFQHAPNHNVVERMMRHSAQAFSCGYGTSKCQAYASGAACSAK
jgi:hypothetical protein